MYDRPRQAVAVYGDVGDGAEHVLHHGGGLGLVVDDRIADDLYLAPAADKDTVMVRIGGRAALYVLFQRPLRRDASAPKARLSITPDL